MQEDSLRLMKGTLWVAVVAGPVLYLFRVKTTQDSTWNAIMKRSGVAFCVPVFPASGRRNSPIPRPRQMILPALKAMYHINVSRPNNERQSIRCRAMCVIYI